MGVKIGHITTRNRVFLAPMSGITDLPFRKAAHAHGAGLVISEMIASKELSRQRADMVRMAQSGGISPFVIQLAGREAKWMDEGARVAEGLGCDAIDINMGCPARKVTGSLSGSALMRDLDLAWKLIEAVVNAVKVPVSVKMRLGWDDTALNAPELARIAEECGVQMLTVHGRTRCQFYTGKANWQAIGEVKQAVRIPVIANGDGETLDDIHLMLAQSGADGVMIGRGCYGRPWHVGVLAEMLDPGTGIKPLTFAGEVRETIRLYQAMTGFYGDVAGVRNARKHLGWFLERLVQGGRISQPHADDVRCRIMAEKSPAAVIEILKGLGKDAPVSKSRAA